MNYGDCKEWYYWIYTKASEWWYSKKDYHSCGKCRKNN